MNQLRVAVRGLFPSMFFAAVTTGIYFFYVCEKREEMRGTLRIMKLDTRWAIVMGTCIALAIVCLPPVKRRLLASCLPCANAKGFVGGVQRALPRLGLALSFALGAWFFHSIYMGGIADAHRDSLTELKLEGAVIICCLGCLASLLFPFLQRLAAYTDP